MQQQRQLYATFTVKRNMSQLNSILYQCLCNKYSTITHFRVFFFFFAVQRGVPSINVLPTAPLKPPFFTGFFYSYSSCFNARASPREDDCAREPCISGCSTCLPDFAFCQSVSVWVCELWPCPFKSDPKTALFFLHRSCMSRSPRARDSTNSAEQVCGLSWKLDTEKMMSSDWGL